MQSRSSSSWYLYIVETKFGHWYTGITTDINKRIEKHESGQGAKNLKGKGPITLVFSCPAGNKSLASKLEWQIKKLTRSDKERLVNSNGTDCNKKLKVLFELINAI